MTREETGGRLFSSEKSQVHISANMASSGGLKSFFFQTQSLTKAMSLLECEGLLEEHGALDGATRVAANASSNTYCSSPAAAAHSRSLELVHRRRGSRDHTELVRHQLRPARSGTSGNVLRAICGGLARWLGFCAMHPEQLASLARAGGARRQLNHLCWGAPCRLPLIAHVQTSYRRRLPPWRLRKISFS